MLEGGRLPDRGPDFERVGCQDWDVISEVATPCRKRPEVLKLGELDDDELFWEPSIYLQRSLVLSPFT